MHRIHMLFAVKNAVYRFHAGAVMRAVYIAVLQRQMIEVIHFREFGKGLPAICYEIPDVAVQKS